MALSDKNIIITPNIGAAADPKIVFSGADANTTAQNITLTSYPTANGTLSFDGSAGQLFSITNSLSGTIFSVNDVSGIPSIEVLDTGVLKLAQYGGSIGMGNVPSGTYKLEVTGGISATTFYGASTGLTGTASININGTVGAAVPTTGVFTTLTSTVAIGTAPFVVTSTTPVANLNIGGKAAGLSATLAIASGGTNSTATPTAGGAVYGTGSAHAITAAGTSGQVLTSAGAGVPTWTTPTTGTVTSVSGTAPVASSGGTAPVISMAAATASVSGYLTAANWNTFNGKYSTGGALGTPSSGTLTNCTFPTLNQNTTGTASNITAYTINQNVGTANTVRHSDITTARAAALTTGYVYYGNTATKYAGFDGTNFISSMPMNFNIMGSSGSCTGNAATAGNATTAGGLAVATGVNNIANQIVRTDGSGYLATGWINTTSGDSGITNRLNRIYASHDAYVRYLSLLDFKVSMGLSGKNNYSRRIDFTADANYHVGSMGHNGIGLNEVFHGGSGFIDSWNGTNSPAGHVQGFNALHYTTNSYGTTGGTAYGIQVVGHYGGGGLLYSRGCSGGTFSAWRTQIDSVNIGSQSVATATNQSGGTVSATTGAFSGSLTTNSFLRVGNGLVASDIYMADSDEGERRIHCNSNRIGFLNQAAGWGAWCEDDGSWGSAGTISGTNITTGGNVTGSSTSCTGNAATATSATSATYLNSSNYIQRTGSSGNANTDFQNTPAGSTRIQGDDANLANGPGNSWWIYQNMRHSNGSNYWGTQVAWGWEDNANRLATRNVTGGAFGGWVYYLNSANYTSYAPSLTGGGASGTWGISVTGTATNASYLNGTAQTSLFVGKVSNTVDINAANDAGSISVRGNATYPACMSFHRAGAYAINVGLSNANNFVIGGWSASANAFSMTGGGALTMLNNITAYSDERLKKNWRDLPVNFVERLADVKHGIYDRTDQECTQVGVSAQSLQPLLPDAIMTQVDGMLSVSYGNAALVSAVQLAKEVVLLKEQSSMQSNTIELLIEAIKEQQVQIDELKQIINKGK